MIIYFFIGTTAELIKLSPVIRELERRKLNFKIIASNQNVLRFEELKKIIKKKNSDYTFKMKSFKWPKDVYLRFVFWIIKSFGNYLLYFIGKFKGKRNQVYFIVHGDTTSALVGALVAKLCGVKLVHIESGLRSFNFLEPFPEEINRFVVSWLSDIHFSPNKWSINNLRYHRGKKVNTQYNTIGEATNIAIRLSKKPKIGIKPNQKYFVLVLHRQEHTLFHKKDTQKVIETFLGQITAKMKCVFIMHHLTNDYLAKNKSLLLKIKRNPNVIIPPRLEYLPFVNLLKNSEFIATDGGSNQEEAYYLGKPCLILRNHTERIEGLGENAVLSNNKKESMVKFIKNYRRYKRKRPALKHLPSKIIVDNLVRGL